MLLVIKIFVFLKIALLQNRFVPGHCRLRLRTAPGLSAALLLLTYLSPASAANELDTIKYYDKGYSPQFRIYLTDVLKLVMDKTVAEYGPYQIEYYSHFLSSNRSKIETEHGKLVNLEFSPEWRGSGDHLDDTKVIKIDFPVFKGLLGLRNLIVKRERDGYFSQLSSADEFRSLIAGQGAGWVDVTLLRENQIEVREAQLFDALFPMLMKNRFDYVPLSILEADVALQTKVDDFPQLVLNQDTAIFYPLPMYLWVNAKLPRLAERLKRGYTLANEDGDLDQLFNKHFGTIEDILVNRVNKLIVLDAPGSRPELNATLIERFLNEHQGLFEVID